MGGQRSPKVCVVVRGRVTGIYDRWFLAEPQVSDLGNVAVYESFKSRSDALAVYQAALRKGAVHPVEDETFDGASVEPPHDPDWSPLTGPWGHNVVTTWHVVIRGLRPGVYPTWIDAGPQVKGVRNSLYGKANSRQEAINLYQDRLAAKQVQALGTRFKGSSQAQVPNDPRRHSEFKTESTVISSNNNHEKLHESFHQMGIFDEVAHSSFRASQSVDLSQRLRKFAQHHSLPVTRPSSPERELGIARSHSENLVLSRELDRHYPGHYPSRSSHGRHNAPSSSESSSPGQHRSSSAIIGNPGHLKPYRSTFRKSPPAENGLLSPLHPSETILSSFGSPNLTNSPLLPLSPRRAALRAAVDAVFDTVTLPATPPEGVTNEQIPSFPHLSNSPSPSRRLSRNLNASQSRTTSADSHCHTFSPHSDTISGSSVTMSGSPAISERGTSRRCVASDNGSPRKGDFKSSGPLFDISGGTSYLASNSRRATPKLVAQDFGFSQPHVPLVGYSPRTDARSPFVRGNGLLLGQRSDSLSSFGRPSPIYHPIAGFK